MYWTKDVPLSLLWHVFKSSVDNRMWFFCQVIHKSSVWLVIMANESWVVENLWFYQRWYQYYPSEDKCPNMEFFLVLIFLCSGWLRTRKNSIFVHFPRTEGNRHSWLSLSDIARVSSSIILALNQNTIQKIKFSINDFFSKCDQIRSFLRIWSHFLKKSLMENFIFCAVKKRSNKTKFFWILI